MYSKQKPRFDPRRRRKPLGRGGSRKGTQSLNLPNIKHATVPAVARPCEEGSSKSTKVSARVSNNNKCLCFYGEIILLDAQQKEKHL